MGVLHQVLLATKGVAGGGGGAVPTDVANLELWLPVSAISQADNSDISTWVDQSGNGRDATGTGVSSAKPKYRTSGGPTGGPCVELSNGANNRWFTLPNFLTGFTSGEGCVVVKILADPPADTVHCGPPLGDWGSSGNSSLFPYFFDSAIYENFGTTARKDTTSNPSQTLATWVVYDIRSAASDFSWQLNGEGTGSVNHFQTSSNTVGWGTAPLIGRSAPANCNLFGYMVEVIMYSRVLNQATERGPVLHTYLNNTYGFSLPTS